MAGLGNSYSDYFSPGKKFIKDVEFYSTMDELAILSFENYTLYGDRNTKERLSDDSISNATSGVIFRIVGGQPAKYTLKNCTIYAPNQYLLSVADDANGNSLTFENCVIYAKGLDESNSTTFGSKVTVTLTNCVYCFEGTLNFTAPTSDAVGNPDDLFASTTFPENGFFMMPKPDSPIVDYLATGPNIDQRGKGRPVLIKGNATKQYDAGSIEVQTDDVGGITSVNLPESFTVMAGSQGAVLADITGSYAGSLIDILEWKSSSTDIFTVTPSVTSPSGKARATITGESSGDAYLTLTNKKITGVTDTMTVTVVPFKLTLEKFVSDGSSYPVINDKATMTGVVNNKPITISVEGDSSETSGFSYAWAVKSGPAAINGDSDEKNVSVTPNGYGDAVLSVTVSWSAAQYGTEGSTSADLTLEVRSTGTQVGFKFLKPLYEVRIGETIPLTMVKIMSDGMEVPPSRAAAALLDMGLPEELQLVDVIGGSEVADIYVKGVKAGKDVPIEVKSDTWGSASCGVRVVDSSARGATAAMSESASSAESVFSPDRALASLDGVRGTRVVQGPGVFRAFAVSKNAAGGVDAFTSLVSNGGKFVAAVDMLSDSNAPTAPAFLNWFEAEAVSSRPVKAGGEPDSLRTFGVPGGGYGAEFSISAPRPASAAAPRAIASQALLIAPYGSFGTDGFDDAVSNPEKFFSRYCSILFQLKQGLVIGDRIDLFEDVGGFSVKESMKNGAVEIWHDKREMVAVLNFILVDGGAPGGSPPIVWCDGLLWVYDGADDGVFTERLWLTDRGTRAAAGALPDADADKDGGKSSSGGGCDAGAAGILTLGAFAFGAAGYRACRRTP